MGFDGAGSCAGPSECSLNLLSDLLMDVLIDPAVQSDTEQQEGKEIDRPSHSDSDPRRHVVNVMLTDPACIYHDF